jgi:DNA invertase Pin-like site-specific DNA recombinase
MKPARLAGTILCVARTQAGLAGARRAGRTGGRPPKLTDDDIEAAKALLANPDIGVTQIGQK